MFTVMILIYNYILLCHYKSLYIFIACMLDGELALLLRKITSCLPCEMNNFTYCLSHANTAPCLPFQINTLGAIVIIIIYIIIFSME